MNSPSSSSASAAVAFMKRTIPFTSRKTNAPSRSDLDDNDNENSDIILSRKKPQFYSDYFKRYELMIEFTNLRNFNHCPLGVYVMPAQNNLNVWFGTLFVHKGYYRDGVFKFRIDIPAKYPEQAPSVVFLTDMFHPLVAPRGNFNMGQKFSTWRPHQDYIFHVLHYIKNAFKKVVLNNLLEKYAVNKDAYKMYRNELSIFSKLALQCAQLSITESMLFDHCPDANTIRFTPLTDSKFEELKAQILSSTAGSSADNKTSIEQQLRDRVNNMKIGNDMKTSLTKT